MTPSFPTSAALLLLLLLFFGVNIHNVITGVRTRRASESHAEVPSPKDAYTSLASIGTILFFVLSLVYVAVGLKVLGDPVGFAALNLSSRLATVLAGVGIASITAGVFLFLWSVVARGRYSVSWEMPRDHKLVTGGPYRHIRHPSYAGYFLMFIGLPLLTQNPVYLLPMMAIPGYVHIIETEERLLATRFGEEYLRYVASTGRFIPRISRSR